MIRTPRWTSAVSLLLLAACERGNPFVDANDLRHAAGLRHDSTVSVRLVAERARWRPDAADGPWVSVEAFAEEGRSPSVPGPLVRVPPNGRIDLTMRNTLHDTLLVIGFGRRFPRLSGDTLRVPPGTTGHLNARAPASGTYAYFGATKGAGKPQVAGAGRQLVGVLQVGDPRPAERLMALNIFEALWDSTAPRRGSRVFWTVNGRMWPSTERYTFNVGDTVRWRIVDGTGDEHPMHLHGFYFRVDGRTTWAEDSVYAPGLRRIGVTEVPPPGGSVAITWVPTRAGDWLFHCHKAPHMGGEQHHDLAGDTSAMPMAVHASAEEHLRAGMGGLIVGIHVRGAATPVATDTAPVHRIRLLVQRRAGFFAHTEGLGYLVQEAGAPASDSVRIPGPTLVLTRGESAEITVVNHLPYQTAVHWHGIELESYYDGVAGWSGVTGHKAPLIAPGDSFVVRMRPPRAGTFIYHTHVHESLQMIGGLMGALIVLEPGQRWDPATDHVFMVHQDGGGDSAKIVINGGARAPRLDLAAGVTHRFRFIVLIPDDVADIGLLSGSAATTWRPMAKDGAALPAAATLSRSARVHLAPGETFDAELTPRRGDLSLEVKSANSFRVPIHVH